MSKKIFIFSDYYKPGYLAGGPIQSIYNMCNTVGGSYFIYTQNFDLNCENHPYLLKTNTWLDNNLSKIYYTNKFAYRFLSWKQLFKIKPEVIYLNSLFSTSTQFNLLQVFFYSIFYTCKIIIAPRGELDEGAILIKGKKKIAYISLFKLFGNSRIIFHATTEKEKCFIGKKLSNKTIVAENIPIVLEKLVVKKKIANNSNFIFISRICPKKNLLFAIKCLQKIKIQGELKFTIIGPFEDAIYWDECKKAISELPKSIKCEVLGPIPHSLINKKLNENHFLLLPTIAENFGHVIYESLINGLPVLISDNTPWDNSYNNGIFAYALTSEALFIEQIEKLHLLNQSEYKMLSTNSFMYAKNKINWELIKGQYLNLFY